MKLLFNRALSLLLLMPCVAAAASPASSEYQAALRAKPDVEHGAELFTQCVACHGGEGQGLPDGSTPRIAGQHFHVLVKQLVDFRYGKRWDFRMQQNANRHLGAFQDIADVASYLSQQPRGSDGGDSSGNTLAHGANIYAENCFACHGKQGEGDDDAAIPMLAGQHSAYLLRQMYDAVDGRRPTLTRLHSARIKPLDFEQLRAVANYLSQIGPVN
jgi:cytochrome c553